ncbi:MAG: aminodeoxychorismate lyase [Pseudomonadales bacterium]|nr:aminodeoxychorismate lyase [Pseudomonadales bacterium]MCP5331522.1 aminodeoxychorismate lyase [Pseudomonadales bacterium]MCP5343405.1 aminodeoxychorismate lyase [Pseudomonadales bacterium]
MLVNGQHQESLPATDRATHYGDGVFETILIRAGSPVLLSRHLQRLQHASQRLQIPLDPAELQAEVVQLLSEQNPQTGVLKILLSRGSGGRGYTPPAHPQPTRMLQLHPLPAEYARHAADGIHATRCQHPLSVNPALAGLKHLNRLDQVMASLELSADTQEGLMCDPDGTLIEGIKSNVFVHDGKQWLTPDLHACGVNGIMRQWLLQKAAPVQVSVLREETLLTAEEVFVCNSVFGIWPVRTLQWGPHARHIGIGARTRHLQSLFEVCQE